LLIPYVKVIPTGAIPTIIQGSVTVNSTTYAIYSYELLNGTVISLLGFNNIAKVYTYHSTPNI